MEKFPRRARVILGLLLAATVLTVSSEAQALSCAEWLFEKLELRQPADSPLQAVTLEVVAEFDGGEPEPNGVRLWITDSSGDTRQVMLTR